MARKNKKVEEPLEVQEAEVQEAELQQVEVKVEETVAEAPVVEEAKPEAKPEETQETARTADPSMKPAVVKLLRIFNSYDELYISRTGGVFPKGHLPSHVKDAVLYKNPFYKNVN